ncbi:hypothetical protein SuNHUV7_31430 (plasmid) [Pseudoseohaeicola sp. NH-UV-7]|mgnify:FL=1|uniref:DUF4169 family protein n=1 Tax=unclassified Sulfitobacter TaxID=196795 RepID=UPI000E0C435E|nr:DUF4169 family protein [Sulfitobacter sp. JL08]AXI54940.1 DUF4169 domain-containing protein [Sulfitobacter sp. JL08]
MTTPVNLNKARKARAKTARKQAADENAAKHGLTKTQRDLNRAKADRAVSQLDAHKRET